jgi:hypothetical protein
MHELLAEMCSADSDFGRRTKAFRVRRKVGLFITGNGGYYAGIAAREEGIGLGWDTTDDTDIAETKRVVFVTQHVVTSLCIYKVHFCDDADGALTTGVYTATGTERGRVGQINVGSRDGQNDVWGLDVLVAQSSNLFLEFCWLIKAGDLNVARQIDQRQVRHVWRIDAQLDGVV